MYDDDVEASAEVDMSEVKADIVGSKSTFMDDVASEEGNYYSDDVFLGEGANEDDDENIEKRESELVERILKVIY